MISSLTRVAVTRVGTVAPRAFAASGSNRAFSMATDLAKKEKVEEDRYIRMKEHEDYLKRKAVEEANKPKLSPEELKAKEDHDIAVAEVFVILSKTGCKISDDAVENLADWKLGRV